MNFLKIVAVTVVLFAKTTALHGQPMVFSCQTPPAGSALGLTAELQRQTVVVTGIIGVNCCATKEYSREVTDGLLKVTLATTGFCDCIDQPCQIELFLPVGVSAVSRVTVMNDARTILLDTSFVQTGLVNRNGFVANNTDLGRIMVYDLHGRVLGGKGNRLSSMRRTRMPRGVYLTGNPDRSIAVTVQP